LLCAGFALARPGAGHAAPAAGTQSGGYTGVTTQVGTRFAYVVLHALDRDGFCDASAFNAVSLHPVLTDAPNDTIVDGRTRLPSPRYTVDFLIDSGDGVIVATSAGATVGVGHAAIGTPTYSTLRVASLGTQQTVFPPLAKDVQDECQAWVRIASASDRPVNVLVIVHDDTGDIGFDRLIDFSKTAADTTPAATPTQAQLVAAPAATARRLETGWNLFTWDGADGIAPAQALSSGANGGILGRVTALYGWDPAAGRWAAFYPGSVGVPGANDLNQLNVGQPYWLVLGDGDPVMWQVAE
jgi:hypothetical protein